MLDVGRVLGRRLEEGDAKAVREFLQRPVSVSLVCVHACMPVMYLRNCVLDDLLVRHIGLVAHQKLVHTLGSVAVDLLEPLLDVVERVHVGDIVNDTDAVGTAVVGRGDGTEALLTGGVPL